MQLHEIKPIKKGKKRKRIGRGGKRGTYSGKGIKGQKSRAGRKFQPIVRYLIKRYPKLRGHKQESRARGENIKTQILNLDILEKNFNSGETVSPSSLLEKRIVGKIKGRFPRVKVLGAGSITKVLTIENCRISKQAREKIEKTGGVIK